MEAKLMTIQEIVNLVKIRDMIDVYNLVKFNFNKIKYKDRKDIIYNIVDNKELDEIVVKKVFNKYLIIKGRKQIEFIIQFIDNTYSFIDIEKGMFYWKDIDEEMREKVINYKYKVIIK